MAGELEVSETAVDSGSEAIVRSESSLLASTSYDPDHAELPGAKARRAVSQIKLICIDMDGELCKFALLSLPPGLLASYAGLLVGQEPCPFKLGK